MNDPDLYQKLVDIADAEFNVDLVSPLYAQLPAPTTADERLDREQMKQTLIHAEVEADMAEGSELVSLKKMVFDWMNIPEEDWYD